MVQRVARAKKELVTVCRAQTDHSDTLATTALCERSNGCVFGMPGGKHRQGLKAKAVVNPGQGLCQSEVKSGPGAARIVDLVVR